MCDEAWKASLTFSRAQYTDLPLSNVLHPLSEGSLQASTELQGVAADLDYVVDKSAHGRQGKCRREEHHIAKLNEHFLVVLKCVLLGSNIMKQYYFHGNAVAKLDIDDSC